MLIFKQTVLKSYEKFESTSIKGLLYHFQLYEMFLFNVQTHTYNIYFRKEYFSEMHMIQY